MTIQDTFQEAYEEVALKVHGLLSIPRARETFRRHIKEYEERSSGERQKLATKYTRLAVLHDHCFPDEAIDPLTVSDKFNKTRSLLAPLAWSAGNKKNRTKTIMDLKADLIDVEADLKANVNGQADLKANANDCVFQKKGDVWRTTYKNETTYFADSMGMWHIHQLLSKPGESKDPIKLWLNSVSRRFVNAAIANPCPATTGQSRQDVLTERALQQYRETRKSLKKELREDKITEKQKKEIENSLKIIDKALSGKHEQSRTFSDETTKSRERVTKAITRQLKSIEKEHHPLWLHLTNSIPNISDLRYSPEETIDWIL